MKGSLIPYKRSISIRLLGVEEDLKHSDQMLMKMRSGTRCSPVKKEFSVLLQLLEISGSPLTEGHRNNFKPWTSVCCSDGKQLFGEAAGSWNQSHLILSYLANPQFLVSREVITFISTISCKV